MSVTDVIYVRHRRYPSSEICHLFPSKLLLFYQIQYIYSQIDIVQVHYVYGTIFYLFRIIFELKVETLYLLFQSCPDLDLCQKKVFFW